MARNLLVHDIPKDGILIDDADANVDVYNNIVYGAADAAASAVGTALTTGTARIFNNTVYGNTRGDQSPPAAIPDHAPGTTSRRQRDDYNVAVAARTPPARTTWPSNASGTTHSPAGGGINNVTATASPTICGTICVGFSSITGGAENLHLIATTYTNQAKNAGANSTP